MSEYIEIETELTDDLDLVIFRTNLALTLGAGESYHSPEEMEEGSPVAQALALLDGVVELHIEGNSMQVRRESGWEWHHLVADISAALKEFFL
jgi:hypothetical protein